ncbi:BTAD domain-containing putative transcriptional regulator [Amycolatopsis sp. NPDC051716]|uniref:AfsR/SARP family transcriptional regulator n=1 Tax=Amycolatopsis sp. NPDC051716 TaxID=3155804 RepID=UPI00341F05D2
MAAVVRLLGEVAADVDGVPVDLGPPRQRCVLTALAVDAGRAVPVDRLVERVWGADVAQRARATLHSYISRLRRALAGADGMAIGRRSGGYVLVTDAARHVVDLHRFRELCARARSDDEQAVHSLTEALALWQGEALTGLTGAWVEAERSRLRQERLAAEHDLVDARLRAGEGGELVAELSARTTQCALDERVAGQYMLALHRAGRTTDALEHYRQVRARLIAELGTEPGATLQELHQQVLAADPGLTAAPAGGAGEQVAPRQLPAAPAPFVGRHPELDRLDDWGTAATPAILAIAGPGGIGKTWLALHWAHRQVDRFPDGQLFVDLHGFSPDRSPMDPAVAVRGFLDAWGVDPGRLPVAPHAQAALFRSLVAGKRMLLVLDNAADTAQIAPLLPGSTTCTVVVTSRNRLPGLITQGARHVPLDFLPDTEARALLTERLGAVRVRENSAAVDDLLGLCGGYPLPLSIIAGEACTRPLLPLTELAAELRQLGLSALADDDPAASLPCVLSWTRHTLTAEQDRLFALLGLAPGTDHGLAAVASLAGVSLSDSRMLLRGLEQVSLIFRNAAGRYVMHDLIHAYATDIGRELPEDAQDAALHRVLDFYAHTAHNAGLLLGSHHDPVRLAPPVPGTHRQPMPDAAAAMAWFDAERAALLAAQQTASHHHLHHTVWGLALSLNTFHHHRGHRYDRLAAWRAATDAAAQLSDPTPLLVSHRHLGHACAAVGLRDEAIEHLQHAITLAEQYDDPGQQAHAHQALARVWGRWDDRHALDHATRALRLFRELGPPLCEAHGHHAVGWYTARLGDHDTAHRHFRDALGLHRAHHNPTGEANTLDSLGYVEHHNGDHRRAVDHYRQALALRRGLGNAFDSASTLEHIGQPYIALGRHEKARAVWQEALELYRQQGRDEDVRNVRQKLDTLGTPTR